jgi:cytochrome c
MKGGAKRRDELIPAKIAATAVIAVVAAAAFAAPPVNYGPGSGTADPDRGKILFEKRCTGCHSLDQNKEGPHLRDVYGRRAGKVADFGYSDALKAAQFSWDDVSLEKWLTDTESVIPNNDMAFRVPSAEERADIIAFLRSTAQATRPQ